MDILLHECEDLREMQSDELNEAAGPNHDVMMCKLQREKQVKTTKARNADLWIDERSRGN